MKRVVLTDTKTRDIRIFESPPWYLKAIVPAAGSTFDIALAHDNGASLLLNVQADYNSLLKRFVGW
ncbi:hypothetical protein [Paracoccus actinidiae]|uniref:hypothetical protein n=1 Tax=Paracoccus actinidiae TaxID=3064531 RepID=UPI0027D26347|nr:hypothetical protein [Paracoccus sp. M09]